MAHMVPTEFAHGYVAEHKLDVFITPDGLVIRDEAAFMAGPHANQIAMADDDAWFEELQAFPIVNGMVDITPIKQWLGY